MLGEVNSRTSTSFQKRSRNHSDELAMAGWRWKAMLASFTCVMHRSKTYNPVLDPKTNEPTEYKVDSSLYASGSDGGRTRDLRLDRPAC